MPIRKHSRVDAADVVTFNYLYVCNSCGENKTTKEEITDKKCDKCKDGKFQLVSTTSAD